MGKISTYPVDSLLSSSDLLIGTDADNANATKNYSLGDIAAFVQSLAPSNTLQEVLDAGNTATQDIVLTGDITILGGANIITSPNASFGKMTLTGRFTDGTSSVGVNGQALTSTGVATQWKTIDLAYILQEGNSASEDMNLVGQITTSQLWIQASLFDSTGAVGTNGQLLGSFGGLTTEWVTVDLDYILGEGDTAVGDINLTGNITLTGTGLNGNLSANTVEANQALILNGTIEDTDSSTGLNGQLLSSSVTAVSWITVDLDYILGQGNIATQGIQLTSYLKDVLGNNGTLGQVLTATASNTVKWTSLGLQNILDANNTAIEDINLTGTITVDNIVSNTDIKLLGTITDGNTSIGTPGQVLTATGGNVLWEDAEAAFTSYRGSFYSLVDQTLTAPNTAKAIILGSTDAAATNGVSITSDGANLTRITFAHAGVYNVVFSAQLENSAGSSQTASFWLRKNGLILADNVPNTNGKVELQGGTNHAMAAWNYFIDVNAGDFIHLMFAATSTNISLVHDAASGPSPATPSVILTVNKV
jgi:hypothetical protein